MTYRIHRSATPETVLLALSGDLDIESATWLRALLENEAPERVTLDLKDVTLVDRNAVHFLVAAEAAGIRIVNCPDYVRTWMAAETDCLRTRGSEPDEEHLGL